jgi:hypothetical protein
MGLPQSLIEERVRQVYPRWSVLWQAARMGEQVVLLALHLQDLEHNLLHSDRALNSLGMGTAK